MIVRAELASNPMYQYLTQLNEERDPPRDYFNFIIDEKIATILSEFYSCLTNAEEQKVAGDRVLCLLDSSHYSTRQFAIDSFVQLIQNGSLIIDKKNSLWSVCIESYEHKFYSTNQISSLIDTLVKHAINSGTEVPEELLDLLWKNCESDNSLYVTLYYYIRNASSLNENFSKRIRNQSILNLNPDLQTLAELILLKNYEVNDNPSSLEESDQLIFRNYPQWWTNDVLVGILEDKIATSQGIFPDRLVEDLNDALGQLENQVDPEMIHAILRLARIIILIHRRSLFCQHVEILESLLSLYSRNKEDVKLLAETILLIKAHNNDISLNQETRTVIFNELQKEECKLLSLFIVLQNFTPRTESISWILKIAEDAGYSVQGISSDNKIDDVLFFENDGSSLSSNTPILCKRAKIFKNFEQQVLDRSSIAYMRFEPSDEFTEYVHYIKTSINTLQNHCHGMSIKKIKKILGLIYRKVDCSLLTDPFLLAMITDPCRMLKLLRSYSVINPKKLRVFWLKENFKLTSQAAGTLDDHYCALPGSGWSSDVFFKLVEAFRWIDQPEKLSEFIKKLKQYSISANTLSYYLDLFIESFDTCITLDSFESFLITSLVKERWESLWGEDRLGDLLDLLPHLPRSLIEILLSSDFFSAETRKIPNQKLFNALLHCCNYQNKIFNDQSKIESINKIMLENSPEEWLFLLHRLALPAHVNTASGKFDQRSFEELVECAGHQEGLDKAQLLDQFLKIKEIYASIKHFSTDDESIAWFNHAKQRVSQNTVSETDQAELIARLIFSVEKKRNITLRDAQIFSLLAMLNPQPKKGRLAEVLTGEGKTATIAVLAAYKALRGEVVDVFTSNKLLAEEAVKNYKDFYRTVGLTVGSVNDQESGQALKSCYACNIVYGDHSTFEADYLRHTFQKLNIRGERKFGTAIVDEVDSLLLDLRDESTRLVTALPGMQSLNHALALVYRYVSDEIRNTLVFDEGRYKTKTTTKVYPKSFLLNCLLDHLPQAMRDQLQLGPLDKSGEELNIDLIFEHICELLKSSRTDLSEADIEEMQKSLSTPAGRMTILSHLLRINVKVYDYSGDEDLLSFQTDIDEEKANDTLRIIIDDIGCHVLESCPSEESDSTLLENIKKNVIISNDQKINLDQSIDKIIIPAHLANYFELQLPHLIKSARHAISQIHEKRHFLVKKDRHQQEQIIPVDAENTGIIQDNLRWSDGLHLFLQMEKKFRLAAEQLATNFLSNIVFFKFYGSNLFGFTGTMGSEQEKTFLVGKEQQPGLYPVDTVTIPPYRPLQRERLVDVLLENEAEWSDRIILDTNLETSKGRAVLVICETVQGALDLEAQLRKQYPHLKIRRYTRDDIPEERNALDTCVESGEVIIATNLAGRGTDISLSDTVVNRGGLHVILSFLPANERVQKQAEGRAARQGQPGTSQMIINGAAAIEKLYKEFPAYALNKISNVTDLIRWRDAAEVNSLKKASVRVKCIEFENSLFNQFTQILNDHNLLKPLDKLQDIEYYKRLAIEERWGLFINKVGKRLAESADFDLEEKQKIEREFSQEFNPAVLNLEESILNPYVMILCGNNLINEERYDDALKAYNRAIELDPIFAFHAHYYKAFIYLKRNQREPAVNALDRCLKLLSNHHIPALVSTAMLVEPIDVDQVDSTSAFTTQVRFKQLILERYLESINSIKQQLATINDDIDVSFEPIDKALPPEIKKIREDLIEFNNDGASGFFTVSKAPVPWWCFLAVVGLGIAQCVAGLLVMPFYPGAGVGLIIEGVADFHTAITAYSSGEFNWKNYFQSKAISIFVSVVAAGVSSALGRVAAGVASIKAKFATKFPALYGCLRSVFSPVKKLFTLMKSAYVKVKSGVKYVLDKVEGAIVKITAPIASFLKKTSESFFARLKKLFSSKKVFEGIRKTFFSERQKQAYRLGGRMISVEFAKGAVVSAGIHLGEQCVLKNLHSAINEQIRSSVQASLKSDFSHRRTLKITFSKLVSQFYLQAKNYYGKQFNEHECFLKIKSELSELGMQHINRKYAESSLSIEATTLSSAIAKNVLAKLPQKLSAKHDFLSAVAGMTHNIRSACESFDLLKDVSQFSQKYSQCLEQELVNQLHPSEPAQNQSVSDNLLFKLEDELIASWAERIAALLTTSLSTAFIQPVITKSVHSITSGMFRKVDSTIAGRLEVVKLERHAKRAADQLNFQDPVNASKSLLTAAEHAKFNERLDSLRHGRALDMLDFPAMAAFAANRAGKNVKFVLFQQVGDKVIHYSDYGSGDYEIPVLYKASSDPNAVGHYEPLSYNDKTKRYETGAGFDASRIGQNNCMTAILAMHCGVDVNSISLSQVRQSVTSFALQNKSLYFGNKHFVKAFRTYTLSPSRTQLFRAGGATFTAPFVQNVIGTWMNKVEVQKAHANGFLTSLFGGQVPADYVEKIKLIDVNVLRDALINSGFAELGSPELNNQLRNSQKSIMGSKASGNDELFKTSEFPRWIALTLVSSQDQSRKDKMSYLNLFFHLRIPTEDVLFVHANQMAGHSGALYTEGGSPVTTGQDSFHEARQSAIIRANSPLEAAVAAITTTVNHTAGLKHISDRGLEYSTHTEPAFTTFYENMLNPDQAKVKLTRSQASRDFLKLTAEKIADRPLISDGTTTRDVSPIRSRGNQEFDKRVSELEKIDRGDLPRISQLMVRQWPGVVLPKPSPNVASQAVTHGSRQTTRRQKMKPSAPY